MNPIAHTNGKSFDQQTFYSHLTQLCSQRIAANRMVTFAFILYDQSNANVCKLLKDVEYVQALNDISREYLDIFYIDAHNYVIPRRNNYSQHRNSFSMNGGMSFMSPMNVGSTTLDRINKYFKDFCGLDEDLKAPCVLFFQVENELVTDNFVMVLNDESVDIAFNELRRHIKNAVSVRKTNSVNELNEQNKMFKRIRNQVKNGQNWYVIQSKFLPKACNMVFSVLIKKIAGI